MIIKFFFSFMFLDFIEHEITVENNYYNKKVIMSGNQNIAYEDDVSICGSL